MGRWRGLTLFMACLAVIPLSGTESGQVQPFDLKKSRQQLEIMRGILQTTLDFAAKELVASDSKGKDEDSKVFSLAMRGGEFSNISAFYLAGQGAVFTIPATGLRRSLRAKEEFVFRNAFLMKSGDFDWAGLNEQVREISQHAEELARQGALAQLAGEGLITPPVPPVPPGAPGIAAVPQPPAPPAPAVAPGTRSKSEREEKVRRKLSEIQERQKQRTEEQKKDSIRFRELLGQLKVFLIEALANHGDSMSIVKANEYINLVITDDERSWVAEGSGERAEREILSVQKSVISDYKAGRLSLEGFKQKVLNYVN